MSGNAARDVVYNRVASGCWTHASASGIIYRDATDARVLARRANSVTLMLRSLAVGLTTLMIILLLIKLNAAAAQQPHFTLASYLW